MKPKYKYNKYIASIKEDECMDCGSRDIIVHHEKDGKLCKKCFVCGSYMNR